MKSFKQWLNEDIGKSITSSGVDANPVNTQNQASIAVRNFAANPAHADDINKVLSADGISGRQRAITAVAPKIAKNFGPVNSQQFTGMDISGAFSREYFPSQRLFMKNFMRKLMSKKMGKK